MSDKDIMEREQWKTRLKKEILETPLDKSSLKPFKVGDADILKKSNLPETPSDIPIHSRSSYLEEERFLRRGKDFQRKRKELVEKTSRTSQEAGSYHFLRSHRLREEREKNRLLRIENREEREENRQLKEENRDLYERNIELNRAKRESEDKLVRELNRAKRESEDKLVRESEDKRVRNKQLLKDVTDEFKKKYSSESTIQIFSSKDKNIVHFINKENEGIGIVDVQLHPVSDIFVITINQGLDSDENVRINEYLLRNHKTCSCEDLEHTDNIVNQHLDSLFANHSNLQSVSSSCIKSYDKEKRITETPCIVLYCSLKGYIPLEEEKFPEHIEDIPTDVREGYAFATGPGDVNNPLGLGCSIGALGRGESGSLGVFTQNGSSDTGFISCAHVFFSYTDLKRNVEQNRQQILIETDTEIKVRQPGGTAYDQSTDLVCGRVRSGWYGNIRVTDPFTKEELDVTVDLATVQLTDRAPSRHLMQPEIDQNLRELSGLSDWPNYNFSCCQMELDDLERHVYKCGAKTHLTKGSIKMIGSTYKKGHYRDPRSPIPLKNQFEIQSCHIAETQTASSLPGVQEPFISPGDSGSVVFIKKNGENIHPIGLATGVLLSKLCGRSVPIKCFATPFFAVEAALRKIEPGSMIQNFQKRRELDSPIQTLTDNFQHMTTQQIPANTNRQVTA